MSSRLPAGLLHCAVCGRAIPKSTGCVLFGAVSDFRAEPLKPGSFDAAGVVCYRCVRDRRIHAKFYPDCDIPGHDMYDRHEGRMNTACSYAAVVWLVLGVNARTLAAQRREQEAQ